MIAFCNIESAYAFQHSNIVNDSIDRKNNEFLFDNLITYVLYGYTYQNSYKKFSFNNTLSGAFNTVEGLAITNKFRFNKKYSTGKKIDINTKWRYGLKNGHFNPSADISYLYNPLHFSQINISGGKETVQFNQNEPIGSTVNAFYSLFIEKNFMKLYEKSFAKLKYKKELFNGVYFNTAIEYIDRSALVNSSDFKWIDYPYIEYISNNPLLPLDNTKMFGKQNIAVFDCGLRFVFMQKFYTEPYNKIIIGSKLPELRMSYKKGLGDVNYDFVKVGINERLDFGLFGKLYYYADYGRFFNSKIMYFPDYYHFMGNQTIYLSAIDYANPSPNKENISGAFNLLPYYTYSTNKYFIEAHAEHHFQGYILNKIPLLKKLKLQEVGGIHYLSNDQIAQYFEINIGIEHIGIGSFLPKIFRIDYVISYNNKTKISNGIRIGICGPFPQTF